MPSFDVVSSPDLQEIDNAINNTKREVDNRFDFSQEEELISGRSYMSEIIMQNPSKLYNFTNLGYQSYLIAQEELDLSLIHI